MLVAFFFLFSLCVNGFFSYQSMRKWSWVELHMWSFNGLRQRLIESRYHCSLDPLFLQAWSLSSKSPFSGVVHGCEQAWSAGDHCVDMFSNKRVFFLLLIGLIVTL